MPTVLGNMTPGNLQQHFLQHLLAEPHFTYYSYMLFEYISHNIHLQ